VNAEFNPNGGDGPNVKVTTKNVSSLELPWSDGPVDFGHGYVALLDGQTVKVSAQLMKQGARLVKRAGKWQVIHPEASPVLEKRILLSGPIDAAFMDSFIFVKPTAVPLSPTLGEWTQRELAHATKQWRGIFRGDAPAVDDTKLTLTQIASSNLILWGDPLSNAILKRIADKLPVKWTADGVEFGGKKYSASHVPVLIFPNPLNPARYVVLNSGFTFSRSAASGTNSQQTAKLPDWAIVDTSVPPDDKFPGKVVDAGFFDELWNFTSERPK
jgi:hypothetical protein